VPEKWRLVQQIQSANRIAVLPDFQNYFDHVIYVALGVDAARDRQPDEVHFCRRSEHQCADLNRSDSSSQIEFERECNTRELLRRNMRQKRTCINVNRVAAGRLHNRHAFGRDVIAQIPGRSDPISEVIFFERLLQTHRNGFEVAASQSAICGLALRQNQQVVVGAKEAANIRHPIFLCRHSATVAVGEHLLRNLLRGL
jgi:hypothetical protein